MARKIKFALEMADGTLVSNLEDLQKHIKNNDDVKKLVEYFLDGRLEKWLLDRYYEGEAKKLQSVDKDDPDFTCKLCKAIGADYTPSEPVNVALIEHEMRIRKALEEVTSDSKIIANAGCTASTKSELDFLIKNGKKTIYLWGDSFKLPLVNDMSYIGILGKPLVDIVDLDSLKSYGIKFENVNLSEVIRKAKEEAKRKAAEEEAKRKIEEERIKAEELIRELEEQIRKLEKQRREVLEEERRKLEELIRQPKEDRIRREEERRAEEEKIRREEEYRAEEAIRRQLTNAKVGDYIKFGNYPQTANGDIKPIEWQVLEKENNKMLVISKYALEAKRFDSSSNNWANSEICKWLNVEFYNKAFSKKEKKIIKNSSISTIVYEKKKKSVFFESLLRKEETVKSNELTDDKVFLLSKEEAEKYFANDNARKCKATDYAVKNGAWVADSSCGDSAGYSYWWLRSPYPDDDDLVYYVDSNGNFRYYYVLNDYGVVRLAMWINIY